MDSYSSNFTSYNSIIKFIESAEFSHICRSDVMFIKPCRESECVFMRASPCETHFMYMYSTFFSTLHLIVLFDKFEIDVLRKLNVAPTQLHLNAWVAICVFRTMCGIFSMTPTTTKFFHHYSMKENKKLKVVGFLSPAFPIGLLLAFKLLHIITLRATSSECVLGLSLCRFTSLGRCNWIFPSIGLHVLLNLLKNLSPVCLTQIRMTWLFCVSSLGILIVNSWGIFLFLRLWMPTWTMSLVLLSLPFMFAFCNLCIIF